LFQGKLVESAVHPYPDALSEDQRETLSMLVDPVTSFLENENDPALNDEKEEVPAEVLDALKEMGAFGLQVPEEYEGIGLSNTGYARMVEIVGASDLGLGITLGAHQSIGYKGIMLVGTPEQKEKYLPDLATGRRVAAFALTEPSSGSDANSVRTRATLSEDGKHFILNGGKLWISGGGIADVFTVFAQTEVDDPKNPGQKKDKVTAFIVERDFGGVTNGPPEKKMGIKCSNTAEVYFENVPIPVENVLGEVGGGFKVAMAILNNGRFGMGAALSGTMKTCIKGVAAHAAGRTQFGRKLKDFGLIKGKFARMAMKAYAAESMAYLIAANMDRGAEDYQIEAAIGKIFASEAAWYVIDESIQVMGGLGYMKEYPYERYQRDARIFRIFEGTNDILRMFVALTGIQTAAKDLQAVQKASKNPLGNVGTLLPFALDMAKSKAGMTSGPAVTWAPSPLQPAAALISEGTGLFSAGVRDLVMKHGKGIIEAQLPLWRVADAAIDLYAMTAVTSRAAKALEDGSHTAQHELLLANTFCEDAILRVRDNVKGLSRDAGLDDKMCKLADDIFEAEGYVPKHVLGF
jgi:very long chain acyl-CoA dehydrogenase